MKSGCHGRSRTCSSLFQRQLSVPIQSAWQWCKDAESNRLSLRHEFYRLAPFPHGRPCKKIGGTEGNRTLISCLQGRHSPVELRSRGCGDRIRTCCLQLMRLARSLMPLPRVERWWTDPVTLRALRLFRPALSLDQLSVQVACRSRNRTHLSAFRARRPTDRRPGNGDPYGG